MSILSPYIAKFQSLVKKLSDGALSQALQMHADPSDPKGFWLAQEAMGRAAARKDAQSGNANQPTVVQQLAQQLTPQPPAPPQGMPPMPPQRVPGMGAMPPMPQVAAAMPPQGMPPMPPQGMPPQAPPVAMAQAGGHVHDYGIAGLPYEPRYEHGGIVSFAEGGDEELDKGLYEGQSFEGYNPDDVSQMLAALDDIPDLDKSFRDPKIDASIDKSIDSDTFKGMPILDTSLRNSEIDKEIDTGVRLRDTEGKPIWQSEVNPQPPRGYSHEFRLPGTSVDTGEPTPAPAAPFNPNWLVSANAPPALAQTPSDEAPPAAPRRIVDVTSKFSATPKLPAVSAGITTPRIGAGTGNDPTLVRDEPQEHTREEEAKNRRFEEDLQHSYGYNPNLNADFLAENAKDIEALKKESGLQSIRDIGNALAAFSGADSDAKGFVAFSQQLGKNFAESDKAMDMKKDALKKYNRELRLAENDIRNNKVEKGMARKAKAEDQIAQAKVKYNEAQNAFIIEKYKQKREDERKEMEERHADLRNERSVRAEEARTLAAREAATQDRLNAFFISGVLNESDYFNKMKEVSENIEAEDVARYIAATQGVPIDQIDIEKITPEDVAKYAPIIAKEKVVDWANRSIGAANEQKLRLAQVLFGGRGLGSLGTGYTVTPVPR